MNVHESHGRQHDFSAGLALQFVRPSNLVVAGTDGARSLAVFDSEQARGSTRCQTKDGAVGLQRFPERRRFQAKISNDQTHFRVDVVPDQAVPIHLRARHRQGEERKVVFRRVQ